MRRSLLLLALALGACTNQDPFDKPYTWSIPENTLGSNDTNLRVMLQDPRDLTQPTGDEDSRGRASADPVRRLLNCRRARLPQANASNISAGTQSGQTQGGAAGAAGGACE